MGNAPLVRSASPTTATEPAPSSVHMDIYRLQQLTEAMLQRLARVETSHRSLRRRVIQRETAS
jgi:hypothetical protein